MSGDVTQGASPSRPPGDGPTVIVVGLDDSPSAWDAFAWACGQARRTCGRLVVVFVSQLPGIASGLGVAVGEAVMAWEETAATEAAYLRERAAALAGEQQIPLTFLHRHGDPGTELLAAASRYAADLLVVGSSAKVLHRAGGSMSRRLTKSRRIPVLVVP